MGPCKYLVIFYGVSAGQNGPNMGADEEDLVMLVYLVLNVEENKVVGVHQFPVRPSRAADINENILSEEVTSEFGISEHDVKSAPPLESVIRQFDSLAQDELCGDLTLVTDGQLHLRQCLYPESTRKNISLPSYYQRFHDLRKEFQSCVPSPVANTVDAGGGGIEEMLTAFNLPSDTAQDKSLQTVNNMARILQKLVSDGRNLHEPEIVQLNLEPGIRSRSEQVDTNCVVRARGLPWQASDTDIARFFTGLNVSPGGVALCLSPQGRRNGEALVLFESLAHRDMALRRHKHHIGNRYIEVYKATGEDFINVAGGNNSEAQEFLGRGGQVIIRMRGLPYDCTAKQVIEFFNTGEDPCEVLDDDGGVLFVKKPDGRATGDAFVLFKEEGEGEKALQKHKEIIGSRYIELFRSTTAEVQQVLNRSTEPAAKGGVVGGSSAPLIPSLPPAPMAVIPQQLITAGTRKDCIRLRGLPYEAQVEHILEFLGDHAKNIVYQGVHMVFNAQGQPSGEAFIQMDSEASSFSAANNRHHRYMVFGKKQRYIEVFQCSGEDMSLVLTGGVTGLGHHQQQAKTPLLSPGMLVPSLSLPQSTAGLASVPAGYSDPMFATAGMHSMQLPQLGVPPPVQLHPGLIQQRPPTHALPGYDMNMINLLQGLQVPGLAGLQGLGSLQQLPGLNLQSQQSPLLMFPRLAPPLQLPHAMAQHQPRFLLPSPQAGAFPRFPTSSLGQFHLPHASISQAGIKRTHEQAFLPSSSPQGYPGTLPPKRPPVMYTQAPNTPTATPPPIPAAPALLPTPTVFTTQSQPAPAVAAYHAV